MKKQCSTCKEIYSDSSKHFYKSKSAPDGLSYQCKKCSVEYNRQWRKNSKDKIKKYNKRYSEYQKKWSKNHPQARRKSAKKWRENNPKKYKEMKKRQNAKRRKYECKILFPNIFKGETELHHINDIFCVYLPKVIHKMFYCGPNKKQHRNMLAPIVCEIYYEGDL